MKASQMKLHHDIPFHVLVQRFLEALATYLTSTLRLNTSCVTSGSMLQIRACKHHLVAYAAKTTRHACADVKC